MKRIKIVKAALLISLAILFGSLFISFALYASTTKDSLSIVNYLYENDHTILKFTLWMTIPVFLCTLFYFLLHGCIQFLLLCISKQVRGKHIFSFISVVLVLIVGIILFFIPIKHKIPEYRLQATVQNFTIITRYGDDVATEASLSDTPLTSDELDKTFPSKQKRDDVLAGLIRVYGKKVEDIRKTTIDQSVKEPLITIQLPTQEYYDSVHHVVYKNDNDN